MQASWDVCQAINDVKQFEQCLDEAPAKVMDRVPLSPRGLVIFGVIGEDLATIAVGWAIVWFGVLIARWIARGFVPG